MGCDIHIYTEVKRENKWVHADYFRRNRYKNEQDKEEFTVCEIYQGRNYRLFSVLANVRNYEKLNKYISEPKGLPDNCSTFVKTLSDEWDTDGHSHSFLTLKELKDYKFVLESGLLYPNQVEDLEKGILPNSWCRWSSDAENMIYKEWKRPCEILKPIIDKMKDILIEEFWVYKESDDENIRVVFWFDN